MILILKAKIKSLSKQVQQGRPQCSVTIKSNYLTMKPKTKKNQEWQTLIGSHPPSKPLIHWIPKQFPTPIQQQKISQFGAVFDFSCFIWIIWGNDRGARKRLASESTNPLNYLMGIDATETEDSSDANEGQCDYMYLLLLAKRSLQKYTPALLQDARIEDDKLITEVLERNRRGQKKVIQKIVCPFCFTSVAPQNRSGTRRWDVTNFNRHLVKIHG